MYGRDTLPWTILRSYPPIGSGAEKTRAYPCRAHSIFPFEYDRTPQGFTLQSQPVWGYPPLPCYSALRITENALNKAQMGSPTFISSTFTDSSVTSEHIFVPSGSSTMTSAEIFPSFT